MTGRHDLIKAVRVALPRRRETTGEWVGISDADFDGGRLAQQSDLLIIDYLREEHRVLREHALAQSTIQRILADAGIAPAPERGTWAAFLKTQWGAVAAWAGIVRYHVFFVTDLCF